MPARRGGRREWPKAVGSRVHHFRKASIRVEHSRHQRTYEIDLTPSADAVPTGFKAMAQNCKSAAYAGPTPYPASTHDDVTGVLRIENVRRIIRAGVTAHGCAANHWIALEVLRVTTDSIRIRTTENIDP